MELEPSNSRIFNLFNPEISQTLGLANRIGREAYKAFLGPEKNDSALPKIPYLHRIKSPTGEKLWETHPVLVMTQGWLRGDLAPVFTVVVPRKGRQRPAPETTLRLIFNHDYLNPVAYIQPPYDGKDAVVIVDEVANRQSDLENIWPIIEGLNGDWFVAVEDFPDFKVTATTEQT